MLIAKRLFGGNEGKKFVKSMKKAENQKKTLVTIFANEENNESRTIKMAEVIVYGKQVMTLFDSGASTEVMFAAL